jgi:hypothetical protein
VGGVAQAAIHAGKGWFTLSSTSTTASNVTSNINKFVGDSQLSPLQGLLGSLEVMDYVCLGIIYILIIQLVFKLYFKDSINLSLSKLLGDNFKVEFYLNKIMKLNKQMSVFWIWFGFATVLFGGFFSTCAINFMSIYLDKGINTHSPVNNNIGITLYKSIEDALFSLNVVSCLSLVIIISLITILLLKFQFNKKIKNIYIWVLLIVLIIGLAFSGYIFSELLTNIDSYVNIYNNNDENNKRNEK